jgi:hypothetical protein
MRGIVRFLDGVLLSSFPDVIKIRTRRKECGKDAARALYPLLADSRFLLSRCARASE